MRDSIQNRTIFLERRREKIWERLRNRRLSGVKFYRQYSIGAYIADFCSSERRIVVELDGSIHDSEVARAYDAARNAYLVSAGYQVLRFANDDVLNDTDAVAEAIAEACVL